MKPSTVLHLDETHPLNEAVLRFLRVGREKRPAVEPAHSAGDPYTTLGSHPEVVERVWDTLGSRLPMDCRCLVYRHPALVHPASGIVFAFCYGMAYCLRLTPRGYEEALQKGCKTVEGWSDGTTTDFGRELGPDWVLGCLSVDEVRWCTAIYERLNKLAERGTQ